MCNIGKKISLYSFPKIISGNHFTIRFSNPKATISE
jgi:hypothetical protein